MYRYVIDTNVLVAGLRSSLGASFALLREVGLRATPVLSVALVLEYEAVLKRKAAGVPLKAAEVDALLDYWCSVGEARQVHFLWRPALKDPNDDFLLELAVASGCDALVTHNLADFSVAGHYGVTVLTPSQALLQLNQ
ncbi:MAG: PIN domain-containing protein [Pseudomonadota bacterium]